MVRRSHSESGIKCNLKQMDICAGIAKLKEIHMNQKSKTETITCPIVILLSSSDDETDCDETDCDETCVKVEAKDSSFYMDKPSANSTLVKSSNETSRISVIQDLVISPSNKDKSLNVTFSTNGLGPVSDSSPAEQITHLHHIPSKIGHDNKEKDKYITLKTSHSVALTIKNNISHSENVAKKQISERIKPKTPSKLTKTDVSSKTSPIELNATTSTSQNVSSPKKERKGMNKEFLKINNEIMSYVLQDRHLKTLLDNEDKAMLENLHNSNPVQQYICFKLYKWLPKWYKLSKFVELQRLDLKEEEIVELFEFLQKNNIVETDYTKERIEDLLWELSVVDLKKICSTFKIRVSQKRISDTKLGKGRVNQKANLINLITEKCRTQSQLTLSRSLNQLLMDEIKKHMGKHIIKLKENFRKSFYHLFVLATFTNPALYDIDDFFRRMTDPQFDFPDYETQNHVVFYSKSEFQSYVKARDIQDKMETIKVPVELRQLGRDVYNTLLDLRQENGDDDRYIITPHLRRFSAQSLYTSALTHISEKLLTKFPGEVQVWLEFLIVYFPKSRKLGDWYYHLSRIYATSRKIEQAAEIIVKALKGENKNLTEIQIENLADRGRTLLKKMSQLDHDRLIESLPPPLLPTDFPEVIIDQKTMRGNASGQKRRYEVIDFEGNKTYKSVEDIALDYYIDRCGYTDGRHCEGSIIKALFTLFFWDIIYNPEIDVPATFLSNKQYYPLDFYTPFFYTHRKDLIDQRLQNIAEIWSNEKLLEFVEQNWALFQHKTSAFDFSIIKGEKFLKNLVECVGRTTLSKIFERLVRDIRQYRSGLPDLLVWDVNQKKAKFVEVKGENDKLSIKQKMWLRYLKSIGANLEVCHVHSIGSKKKIIKKKEEEESPKKRQKKEKTTPVKKKQAKKLEFAEHSNSPDDTDSEFEAENVNKAQHSKLLNVKSSKQADPGIARNSQNLRENDSNHPGENTDERSKKLKVQKRRIDSTDESSSE